MTRRHFARWWLTAALLLLSNAARATPWLEAGDNGLRSDVELLASHGLINALVTSWPLPAGQFSALDDTQRLANEPLFIQQAAARVRAALQRSDLDPQLNVRGTSHPAVVRSFQTTARADVDVWGQALAIAGPVDGQLRVGLRADGDLHHSDVVLDGSYLTTHFGNALVYGGWIDEWNGPGWISSLILSNNARPFPKVGIKRDDPHAFETRWLHWLGPWQADFFVGLLDDKERLDDNTAFGNLRLSINPLHGLEIAVQRSVEFCGHGHQCNPVNAAFHLYNDDRRQNSTNEEATIELQYRGRIGALSFSPYFQMMNEDTGPFTHAYTSYLSGLSLVGTRGANGDLWRVVFEFADSVATINAFDFSESFHGIAYGNAGYPDGFRYHDRTLGFSLDSDSKLVTMQLMFQHHDGWRLTLAVHRAMVSTPQLAQIQAAGDPRALHNVVSAVPLRFSEIDTRVSLPWGPLRGYLAMRVRNQALPNHLGGHVDGEAGLSWQF
ncbi:capsule assembly Wzi family protein [Solimonas marina]|uniref:capsule assembly Wzi family protein n=1 Tax=Solimonas marina TaxID=2714601 RepID=UPI00143C9ABE